MSRENARAFIDMVGRRPELSQEVGTYRGPGVFNRLVELGARHGFAFTEQDYRDAVVDLAEGELSDEALDEVLRETGLQ